MEKHKLIYSDSLRHTCDVIGLDIPFREGKWMSVFLGKDFLDLDRVKKKLLPYINNDEHLFDRGYLAFLEYYSLQYDLDHNATDLSVLYADWLLSKDMCNGCSAEDYFNYEFYAKDLEERKRFICYGYRMHELCTCNDYSMLDVLDDKKKFNRTFQAFIFRDWMDLSEATPDDVVDFLERHGKVILKPNSGTQGHGVKILETEDRPMMEAIARKYSGRRMVLEEVVQQEESIDSFHPHSLNTLRVYTFCGKSNIPQIMGAAGRFGRNGGFVDNIHSGGLSVIVDVESGTIVSGGMDAAHHIHAYHPDSGKKFLGFQYPNWSLVRETVEKAASLISEARHIGWDVAINSEGKAELIEGNTEPDFILIQLQDQVGKMHLYKDVVRDFKEYQAKRMAEEGYYIHRGSFVSLNYSMRKPMVQESVKTIFEHLMKRDERVAVISSMYLEGVQEQASMDVYLWEKVLKKYTLQETTDLELQETETCVVLFSLEYIKDFSTFLSDICRNTTSQVIFLCSPFDREEDDYERWKKKRFVLDFTESFLEEELGKRGFSLRKTEKMNQIPSAYLYDFQKI